MPDDKILHINEKQNIGTVNIMLSLMLIKSLSVNNKYMFRNWGKKRTTGYTVIPILPSLSPVAVYFIVPFPYDSGLSHVP